MSTTTVPERLRSDRRGPIDRRLLARVGLVRRLLVLHSVIGVLRAAAITAVAAGIAYAVGGVFVEHTIQPVLTAIPWLALGFAGRALLAGARDIDPAEQRRIDAGALTAVPPGPDLPERLRAAAAGRPVYVHIDCDVLDAPAVPGGLSADELSAALAALADGGFAGIEIAEFEAAGDPAATYAAAERLVAACEPVWTALSPRG